MTSYIFVYPITWRFSPRVPLHGFRTVLCHGNLCNLTNAYRKCLSQMLIANAYRKCLLQLCNTSQRISTEIRRRKITDRTIVRQLHITSKNQFHNFLLLFDNSNMIHTPTCYHQLRARTVIPLCITIIVKLLVFHTNVLLKNCKYIAK